MQVSAGIVLNNSLCWNLVPRNIYLMQVYVCTSIGGIQSSVSIFYTTL